MLAFGFAAAVFLGAAFLGAAFAGAFLVVVFLGAAAALGAAFYDMLVSINKKDMYGTHLFLLNRFGSGLGGGLLLRELHGAGGAWTRQYA